MINVSKVTCGIAYRALVNLSSTLMEWDNALIF